MNDERIVIRLNSLLKDEINRHCEVNQITYSKFFRDLVTEKLQIKVTKTFTIERQ